ncbi:MAG: APC family permease [Pseudomonadota bacterium]
MLKRDLSKLDSYATIIGMLIGAGIFVAIGQAGKDAGPATCLAYLLLGPATLLMALPYVIFQSTTLGNLAGGAYIHISRTFKSHFPAFIVMWLTWLTYLGVLSVLAVSVGHYIQAIFPAAPPKIIATLCLFLFYLINLVGIKQFGRMQRIMFFALIGSIALLVIPGLFAIKSTNFTPFLPHGWSGFLHALPVLFFAYAGFDALSQTAGETKDARKSLPRIFIFGICTSIAIYVGVSLVAFGTTPYQTIINSKAPLVDAAQSFLPFGHLVVTIGALMAFLSTINACMMVPSRILFAFAEDNVAPRFLARVNKKYQTPHLSLTINFILAAILIWTKSVSYLIGISMQSLIILYIAECFAMACLPFVNKSLWQQVPYQVNKYWISLGGILAIIILVLLYIHIPNPIPIPMVIWIALGTGFYLFERYRSQLTAYLKPQRE